MKKLSIIMALIMALSCFGLVASAADGNVTVTLKAQGAEAAPVTFAQAINTTITEADILAKATTVAGYEAVAVMNADGNEAVKSYGVAEDDVTFTVVYQAVPQITITIHYDAAFVSDGDELTYHEHQKADDVLNYTAKIGTNLSAAEILANVKSSEKIDTDEYTLSQKVFKNDEVFKSEVLEGNKTYNYEVRAVEINDVENFAQVVASEAAGYDWAKVADANVVLINQIISGLKGACDSLANAEWPSAEDKDDAATTATANETPKTGTTAVAGAAIVVLALSAATAVVLRKKED